MLTSDTEVTKTKTKRDAYDTFFKQFGEERSVSKPQCEKSLLNERRIKKKEEKKKQTYDTFYYMNISNMKTKCHECEIFKRSLAKAGREPLNYENGKANYQTHVLELFGIRTPK